MLITKPLPEEFSVGHLGRLHRLNGATREKKYLYRMVKVACMAQTGHAQPTPVHAVASLIGSEAVQYLQQHSLLPFFGYAGLSDKAGQPSHWRNGQFQRFGFSAINPSAVLCKDCISEDVNFWGFSYWRREHQLLGARWCTRHGNALHFVGKNDAFDYSPTEMLGHCHPYPVTGVLDNANDGLRRYHQVINLMLEQGAPESLALMRDRLAARARNLGLTQGSHSKSNRTLSNRIVNIFPNAWLREVFPRLAIRSGAQGIAGFDNVLRTMANGVVSAPAVATALVALFDDSQSAMAYVSSNLPPPLVSAGRIKSTPQQPTEKKDAASSDKPEFNNFTRQPRYLSDCQSFADAYIKHNGDITAQRHRRYDCGRCSVAFEQKLPKTFVRLFGGPRHIKQC
ncbi:MAG: TniQ family protein [Burkholderiales bacterium]|nr:TniQ family protein [Burkholderiales bacterium]